MVIERMTMQFHKEFNLLKVKYQESHRLLKKELGLKDHDFVTIASLVEKEAMIARERPLIAQVFYNRRRKGMRLDSDPTLVYHPQYSGQKPRRKHRLDTKNPYNTYHIRWPLPGPICNPGRDALRAALHPSRRGPLSESLYFVARQDGTGEHKFSRTLQEHNQAVRRYIKRKK